MNITYFGAETYYHGALRTLERAKERIADPENWAQRFFALSPDGLGGHHSCYERNPKACKWCAVGSVRAESGSNGTAERFLYDAAVDLYDRSPYLVNDKLGHEAVMKMYDRAIAVCRGFVEDA